jgi:transposase-like protein
MPSIGRIAGASAWWSDNPEPEQSLTSTDRVRLSELEHENRRLRLENEFLKKAAPGSRGRRNTGLLEQE